MKGWLCFTFRRCRSAECFQHLFLCKIFWCIVQSLLKIPEPSFNLHWNPFWKIITSGWNPIKPSIQQFAVIVHFLWKFSRGKACSWPRQYLWLLAERSVDSFSIHRYHYGAPALVVNLMRSIRSWFLVKSSRKIDLPQYHPYQNVDTGSF